MDIDRLRYFTAVAESGSMREAADLLRLSPSAISRGVAQLEDAIGRPLFTRVGRGLSLNDDGRRLLAKSRKLLDDFNRLTDEIRDQRDDARRVRVGSFEVFTTYFFGEVARTLFPDMAFRLIELTPGAIEEAVLERRVDLGLTYAPVPHPELSFLKAGQFDMGIFARPGAFADTPALNLPFVVPVTEIPGSIVRFKSLDGWNDAEHPRRVAHQCELLETALELARQGVGVLHCPRFVVRLHNRCLRDVYQLEERPLPKGVARVTLPTYIVKRRDEPEDQDIKRWAKGLRTILSARG